MNDNDTKSVMDVKNRLNVDAHETTVWRWIRKLGFTYKMTLPIPVRRNDEDVKEERVSYIGWYNSIPFTIRYKNLIFVDESPFHLHMMRSHSWSRRGISPNPITRSSRGPNATMILAITSINIVYCEAIYTIVTGLVYQEFLKKI
ncbi:hypothetical protein RF11_03830 [Thelohanellus kitauei]|uniref:Winged helix-turn helix domain-containing protein n=1 Tax=Thelohanellus kitauei TaxID=669202 RepID=A0A0C2MNV3_THEKT|nr:hypothetical protein RF11_03830 [Thelohanellus kitauei]